VRFSRAKLATTRRENEALEGPGGVRVYLVERVLDDVAQEDLAKRLARVLNVLGLAEGKEVVLERQLGVDRRDLVHVHRDLVTCSMGRLAGTKTRPRPTG
jgi:hypothetical protein